MLRAKRALHTKDTQVDMGHSMPTQPILRKVPWAPSQIFLKTAPNVPVWEQWKIPKFQTKISQWFRFYGLLNCKGHNLFLPSWINHAHFERFLEAYNFIVVQAICLKIGTPDIFGLLFLIMQSELS